MISYCYLSFGNKKVFFMLLALISHYGVKYQLAYTISYSLLGKDVFTIRKILKSSIFSYFERYSVYWTGPYETV